MSIIKQEFFARPTLVVARELLGQRLVRVLDGQRLSGLIVETEAYVGPNDSACHASRGRTPRTEVMYGPAGYAYVYFVYGMHYMFNLVTEAEGFPAAVLIRALEPVEGIAVMQAHRPRISSQVNLTNGPGKLCQALAIDQTLHGQNVTLGQELWLDTGNLLPGMVIATGPRIGIASARLEDRVAPWRFWVQGNQFVSY